MVLALFMLMDIVQKLILTHHATQELASTYAIPFSEILPLVRLEVIIKCMDFSDNSKQNEF
jgi:hypothetical protein